MQISVASLCRGGMRRCRRFQLVAAWASFAVSSGWGQFVTSLLLASVSAVGTQAELVPDLILMPAQ